MVYSSKDVPKVKIEVVSKGDMEISVYNKQYLLYRNGKRENFLDTKTNKSIKEMYSSYDLAYGDVLISGIGFGHLALWIANKPEVKSVKVLEISQDILDVFLENNNLPNNITIEVADVEEYITEDKYDCILLDHYEYNSVNHRIKSIQNVAKNIPNHSLIWIWSMEDLYTIKCYDGLHCDSTNPRFIIDQENFSEQWSFFKNEIIKVGTLPDLLDDKINEYIYTYADFLNSKYVLLKDKNI
jgi:hypothetical protein